LVKLGCGGESSVSMLHGSQDPAVALSCGAAAFYEHPLLTNLPIILAELRAAAGADVPIIGMNYHDPFLARPGSERTT
jgi:hypothetical protein